MRFKTVGDYEAEIMHAYDTSERYYQESERLASIGAEEYEYALMLEIELDEFRYETGEKKHEVSPDQIILSPEFFAQ